MNSKAASTLMIVFELLVVILVIFMTLSIAKTYASSEPTRKIILANDIAMMINTLVGTPGDARVEYPSETSKYIFILNGGSITVFLKNELESQRVVRSFFLPQGYEAYGTMEEKAKLCLQKEHKKIMLVECP